MEKERALEIYKKIKKEGESAIDEFIRERKTEELFLDFKQSANDGEGDRLHPDDRKNLAKAISGFGNSEGGVIVWGVKCTMDSDKGDVASAKIPLVDANKFKSYVEGAISGSTLPPHSKVENHGIKERGKESGFVITLVPKSNTAPHQSISKPQYYMRAGSSFTPVPHAVLSGMFGRRPQPWVYLMFTSHPPKIEERADGTKVVICQFGPLITNNGRGIARDTYLNGEIYSTPGDNCSAGFQVQDQVNWEGTFMFGFKLGIICKQEFRLPPNNHAQPVTITLTLAPPFEKDLEIHWGCGCEGSEPYSSEIKTSKEIIQQVYEGMLSNPPEAQKLFPKLLNLKDDQLQEEETP